MIHYRDFSEIKRMNIAWRSDKCICPECGYANPESSSIKNIDKIPKQFFGDIKKG